MKRKTIDLHFAIEVLLRDFVREIVHEELRNLPEDLRASVSRLASPGESSSDEILTVGQVAEAL